MRNVLLLVALVLVGVTAVWAFNEPERTLDEEENLNGEEETETPSESSALELAPETVSFDDGSEATFQLPEEFSVDIAATGLGKARFMTESPDGRIFVPDMVDYNLSHEGSIYILNDFNEETHEFESRETYLTDLRGPNDVAFYTDAAGNDWIYITLTEHLVRYPYSPGDTEPPAEPEVVYEFPNEQHPDAESVVWHITRTMHFDNDQLYVSVGSGCNICEEREEDQRAMILTMTPEGDNVEVYAEGIKNAVGLELVNDTLYATENGVDHLGDDSPDDTVYRVSEGEHYGWPYCYELDGEVLEDDTATWSDPINCDMVSRSLVAFEPHSAPIGITYFEDAHTLLDDTFLVALQGSWDVEIGAGYEIHRVTQDGEKEVFMSGFLDGAGERVGRPVHVLQRSEDSFMITDDENGRIYYVYAE